MERGRIRERCATWGGVSLGIGTLAFALCSSSSAGCSTNLVVLTHGTVTAQGCAAYSMAARLGIGLMVLGAILLLGSFILAVRTRRQVPPASSNAAVVASPAGDAPITPITPDGAARSPTPLPGQAVRNEVPSEVRRAPEAPPVKEAPRRRPPARVGPIAPGEDGPEWDEPVTERSGALPPGWYGNPDNPDKPVQWWDGTRLTDRPAPGRR